MKKLELRALAAAVALVSALWAAPITVRAQAAYADPAAAAEALVNAIRKMDRTAMTTVLGPQWRGLTPPGGVDDDDVAAFLRAADERVQVVRPRDGVAEVTVGNNPWTFPIPLLSDAQGRWRFDLAAGREQLLVRRIGRNELAAMQAMLAYIDAQREYAQADRNGNGVLEYAQRLGSTPGRRDGLIWDQRLGPSPLGPDFAPSRPGAGYHGYRFRILTSQGPTAPGGARDYMIGGRLLTGFALIGWPVVWGETGVMTFMVNHEGRIYERDLGPRTADIVKQILRFEPDAGWAPASP